VEPHFQLSRFAGPLDLLLHLVQKEELDIREISLRSICDQYVEYLRAAPRLDIDDVGEFFVMAATLMSIKARALLPHEEIDFEKELDPEEALIQQLLEYRRLKEATRELEGRAQARRLIYPSRPLVSDAGIPLEEVDVFALVEAFRKVLYETGLDRASVRTPGEERPLREYLEDLWNRLRAHGRLRFRELFHSCETRLDLIAYFLALLELIRMRAARAEQTAGGEIDIARVPGSADNLTWEAGPVTSAAPGSDVARESLPDVDAMDSTNGDGDGAAASRTEALAQSPQERSSHNPADTQEQGEPPQASGDTDRTDRLLGQDRPNGRSGRMDGERKRGRDDGWQGDRDE